VNGRIALSLFRSGDEVHTMNTDGSDRRKLTDTKGDDFDPVWSPGGTRIAFSMLAGGNSDIYRVNAAGGGLTRLTVEIPVTSDGDLALVEQFFVNLTDPVGAVLADAQVAVTLRDCVTIREA